MPFRRSGFGHLTGLRLASAAWRGQLWHPAPGRCGDHAVSSRPAIRGPPVVGPGFVDVVERTISWLHGFRRLRIRWERRDDIQEAFLGLAVCRITHRHVKRLC
jgi:hypothetical protein